MSFAVFLWAIVAAIGFLGSAICFAIAGDEDEKLDLARAAVKFLIWPIALIAICAQMAMMLARGDR